MRPSPIALAPAYSQQIIALRQGATRIGSWSVPTDGLDPPEVLDILASLYSDLAVDPGWGSWFIIRQGMIVGGCSLTEAPKGDTCTIGYSVYPGSQGHGYATAAVAQLMILLRGRGFASVLAETSAPNEASQAVLVKCGFGRTGERFDPEDGDVVMWHCAL
jgi:RimJ/RimL family protein N-acetyltransferase